MCSCVVRTVSLHANTSESNYVPQVACTLRNNGRGIGGTRPWSPDLEEARRKSSLV